jgi:rubredoxin
VQINGETWDSAVGGGHEDNRPLPRLGPTRKWVEVVCCPKCGGLKVSKRDNGVAESLERWECAYCGHGWKELTGLTVSRAYSIQ